MNNSLAKLLECIEPKIADIHANRIEMKSLGEVVETLKELVELGKKSYLEILNYYDQDFIIRTIKIYGKKTKSLIARYKTTRYLLKGQNSDMKDMPQYKDALAFMDNFYTYLTNLTKKITYEYEIKKSRLEHQEMYNKYYLLLKKESIFITEADEFLKLLDWLKLSASDKLDILIYINKCNIKNYNKKSETEGVFISNTNLTDIKKILEKNAYLIDDNKPLEEVNVPILLLGKANTEIIERKKNYYLNKIHRLFKTFEYEMAAKIYKEYTTLLDYEEEFKKQELNHGLDKTQKLTFLMHKDMSFVREYILTSKPEYQGPILKNLLDIEKEEDLMLPDYCYEGTYLYIKPEFIVKTVYTFLENGQVLILGILDKKENLRSFLYKNRDLLEEVLKEKKYDKLSQEERNLLLKNIKIEDLVLTINLNTLDVKMEEENAR